MREKLRDLSELTHEELARVVQLLLDKMELQVTLVTGYGETEILVESSKPRSKKYIPRFESDEPVLARNVLSHDTEGEDGEEY